MRKTVLVLTVRTGESGGGERDRQVEAETDRQTGRERDRQRKRDRQTDRERERGKGN